MKKIATTLEGNHLVEIRPEDIRSLRTRMIIFQNTLDSLKQIFFDPPGRPAVSTPPEDAEPDPPPPASTPPPQTFRSSANRRKSKQPRPCATKGCPNTLRPTNNIQRYCPDCATKRKRDRDRNRTKPSRSAPRPARKIVPGSNRAIAIQVLSKAPKPLTAVDLVPLMRKAGATFKAASPPYAVGVLLSSYDDFQKVGKVPGSQRGLYALAGKPATAPQPPRTYTEKERLIMNAHPDELTPEAKQKRLKLLKELDRKDSI